MDLFKLLGTIVIDNSKADREIEKTTQTGNKAQSKLVNAFSKISSAFSKMFESDSTKKVKTSFDDLTATTNKQKEKLESLKSEYKNLYLQHGKNSAEAEKIAAEIRQLSTEIDKNEREMEEASRAADGYDKSLNNVGETASDTKGKFSSAFSKIGKGAAVVGKGLVKSLAAGGAAMTGLTVKALNSSGELEQNMGGSETVFKECAEKMQETAKKAFSNMGLSASDFLGTANKMGALFQGAGFGIEESADMSASAMQRAADVASIMGIDTASAMEAIAGAAKGNFTMMDNLGVAMNDTTLQAYALSKGITKATSDMTNQEKIGLAMEMFMEKTAYAAGNYAKENQTLAGSLGTAKSALTNFLDGSGDVNSLVSAFSNAANVIVDNVKTLAPRLIGGITDLVNQIIPTLPPLLNQLLPVIIEGAVSLINGLVAAVPAIISVLMSAMPALIDGLMQIMNAVIQALPQLVETLISALPGLIPQLVNGLVSMIVLLCTMLPEIIQPIIDYLPEIIISIVNALVDNLPALIQGVVQLVNGLYEALPSLIIPLLDAIPDVLTSIVNGIIAAAPILIEGWMTVFNTAGESLHTIMSAIMDDFGYLWDEIKTKATDVWNGIKDAIQKPIEKARDLVGNVIDKIKGFFNFKFTWPKIKMPKFGITPSGWKIGDLLKGSIPKLKIDWYAKGGVMKQPTLFDYNPSTGRAKVGGEAGDEAIAPISTLQQYIRAAVQSENAAIAQRLDRIVELLVQFFPEALDAMMNQVMVLDDGTLVAKTAPAMDAELGRIAIKKGRGSR